MEKNRKRTGMIIAIAVVVFMVCIAAAVGIVSLRSPKVMLARGIANLQKELDFVEKPSSFDVDMTMTLPQIENFNQLNIALSGNLDYDNKKENVDFSLGVYHFDIVEGNMVAQDNTVHISMPKLLEDTYMIKLNELGKDFNASGWSEYLGLELDKELTVELFPDKGIVDKILEQIEALEDAIIITKIEDKKELVCGEKTVKCSVIRVTIDEDMALNVFMDFWGEIYRIEAVGSLADEVETIELVLERKEEWNSENKEFKGSVSFVVDGIAYGVEAEGEFEDVISGKSFTLDIVTISLLQDSVPLVRIGGDITIGNDVEEIVVPTSSIDFLGMSTTEVYDFVDEILESLQGAVNF